MGYWEKTISRRKLLASTGAAGLGVMLASAGCGSDDSAGPSGDAAPKDASGLLGNITDSTKDAKRGGIWSDYVPADSPTLDPIASLSFRVYSEAILTYSLLTRATLAGRDKSAPYGVMEGDGAESWETSPDGLTLTFKLRPNHTYDARPPTSGRPLDSQDVLWAWNYFAAKSPSAADVVNAKNPESPVLGIETPDSRTVRFKLAYPWPDAIEAFGYNWFFYLMPREAEDKFNPRSEMRGTGPFTLESYKPSEGFVYKRRDDWHQKGRPFLDGITRPVVTEYATALSQFEAGNLDAYAVRPDDIVAVKRRHQDMLLLQDPSFTSIVTQFWAFSARANSPFRDVRVRRAVNMVLDRDLFIETMDAGSKFQKEGLPLDTRWHSHIGNGNPSWLDPKGGEIGEGGKYFKFDVAGAKSLLAAAGLSKIDLPYGYFPTPEHGPLVLRGHEVFVSMLEDSGLFKVQRNPVHYNNVWQPTYQFGKGDYDGIGYSTRATYNLMDFIVQSYTPKGKWSFGPDSKAFGLDTVQPTIAKMRVETDLKKRDQLSKDIQKELAVSMPAIPQSISTGTRGFTLRWPWLANHGAFNSAGASSRPETLYWRDQSKKNA